MENLIKLEKMINSAGWFGGALELKISLKSMFEGFYGKASETWEQQVTMEIISPDEKIFKSVKIIGTRWQCIDDVAAMILKNINTDGE